MLETRLDASRHPGGLKGARGSHSSPALPLALTMRSAAPDRAPPRAYLTPKSDVRAIRVHRNLASIDLRHAVKCGFDLLFDVARRDFRFKRDQVEHTSDAIEAVDYLSAKVRWKFHSTLPSSVTRPSCTITLMASCESGRSNFNAAKAARAISGRLAPGTGFT